MIEVTCKICGIPFLSRTKRDCYHMQCKIDANTLEVRNPRVTTAQDNKAVMINRIRNNMSGEIDFAFMVQKISEAGLTDRQIGDLIGEKPSTVEHIRQDRLSTERYQIALNLCDVFLIVTENTTLPFYYDKRAN